MSVDLKSLGLKVAKYRNQLQQSIEELGTHTGIAIERLNGIESGSIAPTGDEVLILSDHFKADYKFFISNELLAPFEQTEVLYRAHGEALSKDDRWAIQDFLYLCETEAFLMAELSQTTHKFDFKPQGSSYKQQGVEAAVALRKAKGYTDLQIPSDVYADFRSVGVHVFRRKLGNSTISGLYVNHPVAGSCALVNYSEDVYRQRFSAAHEMAHAVFDSDQEASVSFTRVEGLDLREVRANRFASCYLLPSASLKKLPNPQAWSDEDAKGWANRLKVSCDALGIALKEAEIIDEAKSKAIRKLRTVASHKVDPELPVNLTPTQRHRKEIFLARGLSSQYVTLCFDAAKAGIISTGRLAEALLCTQVELLEIASLYGRNLHGY